MFKRYDIQYMNEASDEGTPGGGGGSEATNKSDDLAAKLEAAQEAAREEVRKEYQGLSAKNEELLGKLREATSKAKKLDGVDLDGLLDLQRKVAGDEILRLHAEGKHDEAYNRRMEAERAEYTAERTSLSEERDTYKSEVEQLRGQLEHVVLNNGLKDAFIAAGGEPSAADDAVRRGLQNWRLEDGKPVERNEDAGLVVGQDGPRTMQEWAASLRKEAPYFFPGSSGTPKPGTGASGDLGGLEAQMLAAVEAGDFGKQREIRKKMQGR